MKWGRKGKGKEGITVHTERGGGPPCGRGVSGGNTIVVAYSTLSIILHNVSRLGLGSLALRGNILEGPLFRLA